jgi:peptidoglycan DL-endopeptidase LytE
MMKRQIFVLSGFLVLCLSLNFISSALAEQYAVKKGDTLYRISKEYGVSISDIQQANNLQGTALRFKQVLNIPEKDASDSTVQAKSKPHVKAKPAAYYTVKKGDTLSLIAKKTGVPAKQIIAGNNIRPSNLRIGQKLALAKALRPPKKETVVDEEDSLTSDDDEDMTESDEIADLEKENQKNAELLGKWGSSDERRLFVKVATGFLGAPYRLGGSTVRGIDCSAFVRKMYQFFDIVLPRTAQEQSHVGLSIDRRELVEGDLVFFRTRRPVGHVGIYVGNNEFVHASSRDKVVKIDSLETPYFNKRFVRAIRIKGLDSTKAANDHGA